MPRPKPDPALALLEAVEALCATWVGKKAPGEQWLLTCQRFVELDKLAKRARKARTTKEPTP